MSTQNPVFIPGPTNIPEELRRAIDFPTIDHRSPVFVEMLRPALDGIRRVLKTHHAETIILPSTGTGAWEAAITNTLSPGDKVLACRHGMFSHRWIDMCKRHGLDVRMIEAPWGAGAPAAEFQAALRADRTTRSRPSSSPTTRPPPACAPTSPPSAARSTPRSTPRCCSSTASARSRSMDFRMDEWGVDIAVTGSQKGFMLPAGLAIVGVSPKAIAAMETGASCRAASSTSATCSRPTPRAASPTRRRSTCSTASASCRQMLEEEGLENVFARHHRLAEGIRRAVAAWGLEALRPVARASTPRPSAPSSCPRASTAPGSSSHAADKYGVAFGVGLGEVAGKVFRIGHLGSLTDVMALSGIATRRDGHGRPRPADQAWQRRRRGAGILPRHGRRALEKVA